MKRGKPLVPERKLMTLEDLHAYHVKHVVPLLRRVEALEKAEIREQNSKGFA